MKRARLLASLALCAALVPTATRAQGLADYDYDNLVFRGLGFDYGWIWPNKVDPTPLWSLRLDLGYLGPAVRIAPTASYWSSSMRATELDRLADRLSQLPALVERDVTLTGEDLGDVQWSDLNMMVDAHLVFTAPLGILTFVGAGAGLHLMNGRGAAIDDTFVEDLLDMMTAGAALLAGLEYRLGSQLRLYGEARYSLSNQVRYPGVRFGAALMLPPRDDVASNGRR
jgi:opacity protein-like surface antigen